MNFLVFFVSALPSPPGGPELVPPPTDEYLLQFHQPDVITLRWKPPANDGGTPISGKNNCKYISLEDLFLQ